MKTRVACMALVVAMQSLSGVPLPAAPAVEPARDVHEMTVVETGGRARSPGFRTIDGSDNHREDRTLNAVGTPLRRRMHAAYPDQVSQMAGPALPSARHVSNVVAAQQEFVPNAVRASDFVWQWGQFLAHDTDLSAPAAPREAADIRVPVGDPHFDPERTGAVVIAFGRSGYDPESGRDATNPRQQLNLVTGWIDASQVYGSDPVRAEALRARDGTGRLNTSDGDLLPFNTAGLPNTGGTSPRLFLAGDIRVNEQVGLTALHTLFLREHNRLVAEIARQSPSLGDEALYQRARRIVAAQMQVITYREFLSVVLGERALGPYRGYDPAADARIHNEFATAVFRFGHSMLNTVLSRVDAAGHEIEAGHLPLAAAFFAPDEIIEHGIEPLLRGMTTQLAGAADVLVVDGLRNFLFGAPGAGRFDLAALNVQRGRDHGLPTYNEARIHVGLEPALSFADISSNAEVQSRLALAYRHVDEVELWIGSLAEDRLPGTLVGELAFAVLKEQFEALRDGDRFWYARDLRGAERREVEATTLADIIRRNTSIGREIRGSVFRVTGQQP